MRNFSNTCFTHVTFSVNSGEYESNFSEDWKSVLQAVCNALEVPFSDVIYVYKLHEINLHSSDTLEDALNGICELSDYGRLTPSEIEVVFRLYLFGRQIASTLQSEDCWKSKSQSFTYSNLNTGVSVVWTFCVC